MHAHVALTVITAFTSEVEVEAGAAEHADELLWRHQEVIMHDCYLQEMSATAHC